MTLSERLDTRQMDTLAWAMGVDVNFPEPVFGSSLREKVLEIIPEVIRIIRPRRCLSCGKRSHREKCFDCRSRYG